MKKTLVVIAVLAAAAAGLGYFILGTSKQSEALPSGHVQRVVKVQRGDLNLTVSANGVVQPINKVEIKSKASGQIVELNFEEGQYVRKGELLIALDQTTTKNDFDQAKADLALSEANAAQQENNYRRALELFEKKLISEQERDQANVERVRAQSQLVKARAALSSAEERLRETRITAPISGIILTRNVEIGQIISSGVSNVGGGTLLATIADMDQVYVETNVDEVDIGRVQEGQRARVVADAFPEDVFTGEVIRISPLGKSQQNVTTFNVIVLVRNIGGKLKAGMSTSVDIEIFRRQNVVLVPNEALRDPRSEQGQALLASIKQDSTPAESVEGQAGAGGAAQEQLSFDELRKRMEEATPEERQKLREQMRERLQKMSPEERQRVFAQFQQRMGEGGGVAVFRSGPEGMSGGGSMRATRRAQVGSADEIRERIVMVREGTEFVPKLIKIGASNFDYAEVISGLNEEDEIQITTISRAKIAAEQMTERMRSMQGVGGIGGGRVPSGGGRR